MKNRKSGITLISLVITVVVMLILAGVAIAILNADNGLFNKTTVAAKEYNKSAALEKVRMKILNLNVKTVSDTGEGATAQDLIKMTDESNAGYYDNEISYVSVDSSSKRSILRMAGFEFNLDENLTVTHINGEAVNNSSTESGKDDSKNSDDIVTGPVVTPGKKSSITVKLADGMVPVVYNETNTSWYVATKAQIDNGTWFNYLDTSESGNANKSQWANVMLRDGLVVEGVTNSNTANLSELYGKKVTTEGSMYVWIPRYAYKFESGYHSDQVGEISVKFLNTNNTFKDGSSTSVLQVEPAALPVNPTTNYVVHPAFSWSKADGTPVELEGIWIGKFEASSANATYTATQAGSVLTSSSIILRSVGNVSSWRSICANNMFLNCYNMNNAENALIYGISTDKDKIDPHMVKNTEWGAVAYLAHSKYGKNKIVGETMSNTTGYMTGNGNYKTNVNLSTTGNVYGVYDMAGGAQEYVAAYVDATKGGTVANSYLTSVDKGKAIYDAEDKYKDVYPISSSPADSFRNYQYNATRYGDAIYETSLSSYNESSYFNSAWNTDRSRFPNSSYGTFFLRGSVYSVNTSAGIFAYGASDGTAWSSDSFRSSIITM